MLPTWIQTVKKRIKSVKYYFNFFGLGWLSILGLVVFFFLFVVSL